MWSREFAALAALGRALGELQAQHQRAGSAAGDSLHACLETNELIPALRPFPRPLPSILKSAALARQGNSHRAEGFVPGAPCADLLGSPRRAKSSTPPQGPGAAGIYGPCSRPPRGLRVPQRPPPPPRLGMLLVPRG